MWWPIGVENRTSDRWSRLESGRVFGKEKMLCFHSTEYHEFSGQHDKLLQESRKGNHPIYGTMGHVNSFAFPLIYYR